MLSASRDGKFNKAHHARGFVRKKKCVDLLKKLVMIFCILSNHALSNIIACIRYPIIAKMVALINLTRMGPER